MSALDHEKQLFDRALDFTDAAEREDFLRQACGADGALLQRMQGLLAAHDVTTAFQLKTPRTLAVTPGNLPTERPGAVIGRYKLLERVGEGGCGVVYVAEQTEPVRRRVALKVIKLGMDTKSVVARFEAERQALAMMDHPNIAKVLDAGATELGRPYFVMELVRGIPITHYCDQNNLGTAARLDLFIQVCHAIQHAHQKGIIHRDIKPSNILVTVNDGVPVPKVIDFGIAKATEGRLTDATVYTQLHQFIGTPAYMSPEQAEMTSLDIDTRSDIYSLGVLLYELLSGRTPFDARELMSAGLDTMRKIIREQEPARPSTKLATLQGEELSTTAKRRATEAPKLLRQLQGDLDWIVMKCLEKDRTRRYETANGLAADLQRHLSNEPVIARPPSTAYRIQKAYQRNKAGFAVAALIAAVLVAATAFSTWQARVARNAAAESQAITQYLIEVFRSPDPTRDGSKITVAETLDRAVKKLESDLAGQPARQVQLQETFAETYRGLALPGEEFPLRERVFTYHREHSGPEHPRTVRSMIRLAASHWGHRNESTEIVALGVKLAEDALALSTRVSGRKHTNTLSAMEVLVVGYRGGPGLTTRNAEGVELATELLRLSTEIKGREHPDTIRAIGLLAIAHNNNGNLPEAIKLHEEALVLARKVNGEANPETITAIHNLAFLYSNADRNEDAIKLYQEALDLGVKVKGAEHAGTWTTASNLADAYRMTGRLADWQRMLDMAVGDNVPSLIPALELALHQLWSGDTTGYARLRERVLRGATNTSDPTTAERAAKLASLRPATDPAVAAHALNLARFAVTSGTKHQYFPWFQLCLGMAEHRSGHDQAAEQALLTLEQVAETYVESHRPRLKATGRFYRAMSLHQQARTAEARTVFLEGEALMRPLPEGNTNPLVSGENQNDVVMWLAYREAAALLQVPDDGDTERERQTIRQRTLAAAIKEQEEVVTLSRKVHGPEHPGTFDAMNTLAKTYFQANRFADGQRILEASVSGLSPNSVAVLTVAALHLWTGDMAGYAATRDRALRWAAGVTNVFIDERVSKLACLQASPGDSSAAAALALARRSVALGNGNPNLPWFRLALGVAEFRSGDFAAADATFEEVAGTIGSSPWHQSIPVPTVGFYRAMISFRQGKVAEARQRFTEAEAKMKPLPADEKNPMAGGADHDILVLWLAYREAKALIGP